MTRTFQNLLVTGGAGFIGVNLIRWLFSQPDCPARIINVDKLTYAGNPSPRRPRRKSRQPLHLHPRRHLRRPQDERNHRNIQH